MPPPLSTFIPAVRTVLLASVLKSVDDTRMYEKFAGTLAQLPYLRVHVAGRGQDNTGMQAEFTGIYQHGLFTGSRLSLARLLAQRRYWQLLQRLHPDLVVVHAPELLPLTLLWQLLGRNRQFIYDVRENYALNVSTQQVYGTRTRRWLAAGLRQVETWAARRATAVILAEESYADELPYLKYLPAHRVVVLENKYQPSSSESMPTKARPLPAATELLRLLYSGTISELNGIHQALTLAEELHRLRPGGALLTVIGFCQQPALLRLLQQLQQTQPPWLRLVVEEGQPVSHATIVAEIQHSHVGLLFYQPHPSTERCRPTKLFEYLAHGLPMLVPPNPLWETIIRQHEAGFVVNLQQLTEAAAALLEVLNKAASKGNGFYPRGIPTEAFWTSEAIKLRELLNFK